MATCRANRGNLLQHWTLCEVLSGLKERGGDNELTFVDAFAMAPFSEYETADNPEVPTRSDFRDAHEGLRSPRNLYQRTWSAVSAKGYPSSAVFAQRIWPLGKLRVLLCDTDADCVTACESWVIAGRASGALGSGETFHGDWRDRFAAPLFQPDARPDAVFLSLDPDMYDRNTTGVGKNARNLNGDDVQVIIEALDRCAAPVVVQLSTYSANNDNRQADVLKDLRAFFEPAGFSCAAVVCADGQFMSLVFLRGINVSFPRVTTAEFPWRKGDAAERVAEEGLVCSPPLGVRPATVLRRPRR